MLRLQVNAPLNRIFKLFPTLLKNFNCFGIGDSSKLIISNISQPVYQPFVHKFIEELHFLRTMPEYVLNDIFYHCFRKFHIILKIRKSDFRLNHPELCRMTLSIGDLCAERRSESIDIPESHGKIFTV